MKLKGMDKLRGKLPGYPGKRIFLLPLRGLVGAVLAYSFLIFLDILPRLFPDIAFLVLLEPILPILGSLVIGALAVSLIAMIWKKRDPMKVEYGDLAYQKVIPKGVMGVMMIPSVVFHAATSIRSLPPVLPVNDLTTQFSQSLLPLLGITGDLDILIRLALAGFFAIVGMLVIRSSILTFGIDYMTVVYLYFPEESEIQEHEIYSIVRHPAYMSGVILGGAAMFFRCSVYSILIFLIAYLIFKVHIRREEAELIDRFGEGYREYKQKVPGLYVRPRDLMTFIRFLFTKPS
ncbi:isoprenylcysteine carboxylmethyltransferase family protein [Candidatus Thorarchaeota archaeon]|nr:MAG: isoprenylcysteine carboxylmethyltransferase family protein [Candidatus Thorarchaeota archaeon]